jgi:DNA-binding MarR family transcriptional regulator
MPKPDDHSPDFQDLYRSWMRIMNKMNIIENMPRKFGTETTLFLSEIHTLQTIGRTEDCNIRTIAAILGVTPSAASQTVTRLTKKGFVQKLRGIKNEREVSLVLTANGRIAYDNHEKVHEQIYERITGRIGELTGEERVFLARIFSAFESIYNERIIELASQKGIKDSSIQDPCIEGPSA